MKIVTVIPLAKSILKEDLTYFTAKDIPDGSIVEIPLRNKKTLGIAVSSEDVSATKSDIKNKSFNLRKILDIKEHSIFSDEFLSAGIEMSRYFASPKGLTLTTLIPASFRENYDELNLKNLTPALSLDKERGKEKIKPEKKLLQTELEDRLTFYKTLIRGSFAEKKSVFMILPTERDIKFFSEILSKGIESFTFSVHGGMSAKKQIESFKEISGAEHPVLIFGTAQFLSIPRNDIGTMILEHENAIGYKMFSKPHLDMRIFAEIFAVKIGAEFILADTLLRFETIQRRGELPEARPMNFRLNFKGEIIVENTSSSPIHLTPALSLTKERGKFKIFSDKNLEEIKKTIEKKENVFIFSLRKGYATLTVCKDCGESLVCEHCTSPVVLHLSQDGKKRMFICNRCKKETDPDARCVRCGGWNLFPFGIGTDTVYEELKNVFNNDPDVKIFKLDKESAKTQKGAEKIIKEYTEEKGAILIGTEMAFFYMKEKVSLSVIASFDSLWSIPNFKMSEKIIDIIFSLISFTEKKLIIQTKNETDPALTAIKNENLLDFVREELADREALGYPPFKRFIKISYLGNKEEMLEARKMLTETFKDYDPEIFSGFVSKLKGKYTTNALLKLDPQKWSLPELSKGSSIDQNLLEKLYSLPPTFSINVDPEDLL